MFRKFVFCAVALLSIAGPLDRRNAAFCEESSDGGDFPVPAEAVGLLAKSRTETCSVCIEKSKERAFGILADSMMPYKRLSAGRSCPLVLADRNEPELQLSCYPAALDLADEISGISEIPALAFRFHTGDRHMVGISPDDFTGEGIADFVFSAPRDAIFQGTIELVPYRYGDGPTFIYFPETNRLAIQCRIVKIETVERIDRER